MKRRLPLTEICRAVSWGSVHSQRCAAYLPSRWAAPPSVTVLTNIPSFSSPASAPTPIPMMLMPSPSSSREGEESEQRLCSVLADLASCWGCLLVLALFFIIAQGSDMSAFTDQGDPNGARVSDIFCYCGQSSVIPGKTIIWFLKNQWISKQNLRLLYTMF